MYFTKRIYCVNYRYGWLIQDLPTSLIAAFRSTLEEVKEAYLLLHVVDTSNPDYFQHEQTVNQLLEELETSHIQQLTVYNKKDIQHPDFVPSTKNDFIQISTLVDNDREQLKKLMETKVIGVEGLSCGRAINGRKVAFAIEE